MQASLPFEKNEKKLFQEMSKCQIQDVDCIARRGVFLPVQTGHCSNIKIDIQGPHNKFPDLFRIGTFIDSTHMKL